MGPSTEWGPGQNAPVAPPLGGPDMQYRMSLIICRPQHLKNVTCTDVMLFNLLTPSHVGSSYTLQYYHLFFRADSDS